MGAYIARRLLLVIPPLLGIMILNFALVQFVPGGPIEQIIAQMEGEGDVFEAISGGAAQSWQMVNRGETMVKGEFDFGFAIDWMRKDLRICLEEAKLNGADLPVTEIVAGYYAELSADGFGRNDTSSLIRRLRQF